MNSTFFPLCAAAALSVTALVSAGAEPDTILTPNAVELREKISPQGFVHPGISCNAETLSVMRDKVIKGVAPWVDHFEGMRRTRFADPNRKPALVEQIVNDGGINGFAHDAHLAWVQAILYVVTGDEKYRKLPVEIIKWYGSRTEKSFFPEHFPDSHIKIGKYVYTMCSAADILRSTFPKDEKLAVTQEMIDALQKNCMHPIRKNCIERNDYFMNQHSYAIMGFLASTILGDEGEDYKKAVECREQFGAGEPASAGRHPGLSRGIKPPGTRSQSDGRRRSIHLGWNLGLRQKHHDGFWESFQGEVR